MYDFQLRKSAMNDHIIDLPVTLDGVDRRRAVRAAKGQQTVIAVSRAHLFVEAAFLFIYL